MTGLARFNGLFCLMRATPRRGLSGYAGSRRWPAASAAPQRRTKMSLHDHDRDHDPGGPSVIDAAEARTRSIVSCGQALRHGVLQAARGTSDAPVSGAACLVLGSGAPVGAIMPQAPSSAPLAQLEAEQPVALERGPAATARRSCRPKSRSGRNRAHRRAGSPRDGRAAWRRRSARVHQRGADAELAAGIIDRQRAQHQRRDAPALTCHNRTVPTSRPSRTADKARPSAGARPSRRRWQVRIWRFSPKQASSSASRATTSELAPHGSRTERHRK